MIKLKKLLKEEVNGEGIEYLGGNNHYELYTILDRNGFSNFAINGNNNVADNFGFTESNWNRYCTGNEGRNKQIPVILTKKDTNEVVGCFLSSQNVQSFEIRRNNVIQLNYSFESVNNSHYYTLEHSAPLYLLPALLVTNNDDTDIDEFGVMCQSVGDLDAIVGIYDDFCREYPTALEFRDTITQICTGAITMDKLRSMAEMLTTIVIPENVDIIENNAIQVDGIDIVTSLEGPKEQWSIENNTEIQFNFGISDEQRQERENQRLAELERQRQHQIEVDDNKANEIIIALNQINTEAANTMFDDEITAIKHIYDELSAEAKQRHSNILDIIDEKTEEHAELIHQEQERQEAERRERELARTRRREDNNIVVFDNKLIFKIIENSRNQGEAHLVAIKSANITRYDEIDIPDMVNDMPVTEIGQSVFAYNDKHLTVRLPANLKRIRRDAFYKSNVDLLTTRVQRADKCVVEKGALEMTRRGVSRAGYLRDLYYR